MIKKLFTSFFFKNQSFDPLNFLLLTILFLSNPCSAQTLHEIKPYRTIGLSNNELILGTYGITFSPGLLTLVSDKLEYDVKCFDKKGNRIGSIGKRGSRDGEFKGPGPIDATANNIAVADFSSNRVQIFSNNFQHKHTFYVESPLFDIRFDHSEHLWIGMLPNHKGETLIKVDIEGHILKKLALQNFIQNEFETIFQMTITNENQIVIVYRVQNKVKILDTTGNIINEFSVPGIPSRPNQIKISRGFFSPSIVAPEDNLMINAAVDKKSMIYILAGEYTEHPYRDIYILDFRGKLRSRLTLPEGSSGIFLNSQNELYSIEKSRTLIRIYKIGK